ncbi:hypothetical protein PV326_009798 [Microctonus aethiopoides]|nr:hypothetical protein PV326_009798 [Microctonus aethiopoides]
MGSNYVTELFGIWILFLFPSIVNSSCREVKLPRDCQALCIKNHQDLVSCELRAAVLLPADTRFDIALHKVMPVLDLAVYHARAEKIFPSWLQLTFLPQDDHCDATYAQIAAIDSYAECVHLFLGPACDYSVASVGRAVKFLNAPLITTGAFTFDFTEKKTACPDEYFMTTRVGSLAFRGISDVFLSVMDWNNWKKVQLVYEPNGQRNFAGRHTCQLMMKSMVQSIKARQDITFGNFDVESMGLYDYRESLKTNIGNYYGVSGLSVMMDVNKCMVGK